MFSRLKAGLAYTVQAKQDIGKRNEQQDAYSYISNADEHLLILADGMGGMKQGGYFSQLAVETVRKVYSASRGKKPAQLLYTLYIAAQKAVDNAQTSENEGGTTLVLALIKRDELWFLSVGDSRLYLLRGGGLIQLTRDQVLGKLLEERAALGFISMEDALMHTTRGSLDNYIGAASPRAPDQNHTAVHLLPGDNIALMSDGVFRALPEDVLSELLSTGSPFMAERVIQEVMRKGMLKQDNSSLILATAQRR